MKRKSENVQSIAPNITMKLCRICRVCSHCAIKAVLFGSKLCVQMFFKSSGNILMHLVELRTFFYFDMRSVMQSKMTHTCRKSELIQTFYLVLNSEVRDN